MSKERVDVILVNNGYFPTREQAKAAIMAGIIYANSERIDKPGMKLPVNTSIQVKGETHPYVSRGGLKLEKAISEFQLDFTNKTIIDIGASTGGFTDCALQHGARQVTAIDVGYGQLAWKLRQDPRVIVKERTNFRHLTPEQLDGQQFDIAIIDVSFISLSLILPNLTHFLVPHGKVVALVKPQFEAGKDQVGKKGIVKDRTIHETVLEKTINLALSLGYFPQGLSYSPIQGGEGNIEFLLYLQYENEKMESKEFEFDFNVIKKIVDDVHHHFNL